MRTRPFRQVDVFTAEPYRGNPLAVVLDAEGLTDDEMARFANWTNLSETTFLLPPVDERADYLVRIFTAGGELPFAGHPTLGSCHAWLEAGGRPKGEAVVQECGVGLVPIRRTPAGLAFAAPPLRRSGPVDEPTVEKVAGVLGIPRSEIAACEWVDNGPGWLAVLLPDVASVLALRPGPLQDLKIGAVGFYPPGSPFAYEVRAFFPIDGAATEDPVTGSLNASVAQWLLASGGVSAPCIASQGTALGRAGRVHVEVDGGDVWIGGSTVTCVTGTVEL